MKKVTVLVAVLIILFILVFAGLRFTGMFFSDYFQIKNTFCEDLDPGNSYYVDPEAICAQCSDDNSGSITEPWCTLERAFDNSKATYIQGGNKLYLRDGIYRIDSSALNNFAGNLDFNGTFQSPTIIGGYTNEKPKIYGSKKIDDWSLSDENGETLTWVFDWKAGIEQSSQDYTTSVTYGPQGVFIDGNKPVIIEQADPSKQTWPYFSSLLDTSRYTIYNKDTMPAFYYYYETNPGDVNYGKLFVKLPNTVYPNQENIEATLNEGLILNQKSREYITIANLSFRFTEQVGFQVGGRKNKFSNIDSSYSAYYSSSSYCDDCIIKDSSFDYNGLTTSITGNNLIFYNNTFIGNSWRHFSQGWHGGGMKLIRSDRGTFNISILSNKFINNSMGGLWIDYSGDWGLAPGDEDRDAWAHLGINDIQINWSDYIGAGHLIEDNLFIDNEGFGIQIETSPGSLENPVVVRNNYFEAQNNGLQWGLSSMGVWIAQSPYVHVYNNFFKNLQMGVQADTGCAGQYNARGRLIGSRIFSNIFNEVVYPIDFTNEIECMRVASEIYHVDPPYQPLIYDNLINHNVYYGSNFIPSSDLRFCSGPCWEVSDWWNNNRLDFTTWQSQLGFDDNSAITDPLVTINPDYSLSFADSSPALERGFDVDAFNEAYVLCTPGLATLSTEWTNITCLSSNKMNQTRTTTTYDQNNCGETPNQTTVEYTASVFCEFCTPNMVNSSWGSWQNLTTCRENNTLIQESTKTLADNNSCNEIPGQIFKKQKEVACTFESLFPDTSGFSEELTKNLTSVNLSEVRNFTIGVNGLGKVEFGENELDLRNLILKNIIEINHSIVEVNSISYPQFNVSAIITFYNITLISPIIQQDNNTCLECEILGYENETLIFSVPHWTSYSPTEAYCGDTICNNGETCSSCSVDCNACPGSGGGSSGGSTTGGSGGDPEDSDNQSSKNLTSETNSQNSTSISSRDQKNSNNFSAKSILLISLLVFGIAMLVILIIILLKQFARERERKNTLLRISNQNI